MVVRVPLRVALDTAAENRQQDAPDMPRVDYGFQANPRPFRCGFEPVLVPHVGPGVAGVHRVSLRRMEDHVLLQGDGSGAGRAVPQPDLIALAAQDLPRARRRGGPPGMVIGAEVRPPCVHDVPREGDEALEADDHLTGAAEAAGTPGVGGAPRNRRGQAPQPGPRPPLGALVLDDHEAGVAAARRVPGSSAAAMRGAVEAGRLARLWGRDPEGAFCAPARPPPPPHTAAARHNSGRG